MASHVGRGERRFTFRPMNKTVTSYDIQALVDNELDWEESKVVMDALSKSEDLMRYYNKLRQQKILLRSWWNHRNRKS